MTEIMENNETWVLIAKRNKRDGWWLVGVLCIIPQQRTRLHQASVSMLRPLCDDASDSVLIEINEDA